jgi:hypothetical protein
LAGLVCLRDDCGHSVGLLPFVSLSDFEAHGPPFPLVRFTRLRRVPSVSREVRENCMDHKSAPVTINLPPALRRACEERAEFERRTLSNQIRVLLEDGLAVRQARRLIPFFGDVGAGSYGFHFTGLTARGVPFAELTQPAGVNLEGAFSG